MDKIKVEELKELRSFRCITCDKGCVTHVWKNYVPRSDRQCPLFPASYLRTDWFPVEIDWQDEPEEGDTLRSVVKRLDGQVEAIGHGLHKLMTRMVALEVEPTMPGFENDPKDCAVTSEDLTDTGSEEFKAVTDEPVKYPSNSSWIDTDNSIGPAKPVHTYEEAAKVQREVCGVPMPAGYLVVPEPAGRVITETMMTMSPEYPSSKWEHFTERIHGELKRDNSLIVIDIAENVLPNPPEGTSLRKVKPGDVWEEGDMPSYFGQFWLKWVHTPLGKPIHQSEIIQGYICRAEKEPEAEAGEFCEWEVVPSRTRNGIYIMCCDCCEVNYERTNPDPTAYCENCGKPIKVKKPEGYTK